jgi:glycosyltransferase involved in cell wall biosynthesis
MLETLEAVLQQTHPDVEVIVVDDGSTDNTAAVLEPFVTNGRIRYLTQPNQGLGKSRNNGLAVARGKYICFLDDDDLWPEDKLSWQVNAFEQAGPDCVCVYGYNIQFGEGMETTAPPKSIAPSGQVLYLYCSENFIHSVGQTMLLTEAVRSVGGFDPEVYGVEDWDMWLKLAMRGTFRYEPRLALKYRVHPNSMSRQGEKMYRGMVKLAEKHCRDNSDREMVARLRGLISITEFEFSRTAVLSYISMERTAIELKDGGQQGAALKVLLRGAWESPELLRIRRFRRLLFATMIPAGIKGRVMRKSS